MTSINSYDKKGNTALIRSLYEDEPLKAFKKNIATAGVDINLPNEKTLKTPLMIACERDLLPVMKILLSKGADVSEHDDNFCNVFTYACKKPNATYLKALLKHIAPITMAGEKESKKEQASLNALLIFTGMSDYAYAPFSQSIISDSIDCTKVMIKCGVMIDTPHHILLRNKGTVQFCDTALQCASAIGHEMHVKLLLKSGANVNYASTDESNASDGNTALLFASQNGHHECVKESLKYDANIEIINMNGENALSLAVKHKHLEIVRMLLKKKADLSFVNKFNKKTLFQYKTSDEITEVLAKATTATKKK